MREYRMVYGKLREPVIATLYIESGFRDSYVAEAVFENTGEYLREHEILLLEAQNADLIHEVCIEYEEELTERGMV